MSDSVREPEDLSADDAAGSDDVEVYVAPASFAQQRLWSLDRILPGLPTYNVPLGLRLSGPLRDGLLARALDAVVARHEALRTALGIEEGEAVQLISPSVELALPRVDLSALGEVEREAEVRHLLRAGSTLPFDLAVAPLMRITLFRLREREHVLFLLLHHAIADAGSVEILVRELFAVYDALLAGREPDLPELSIQYADYAAWQRQWLEGEALELRLQPWRQRLQGAPFELRLPADRPRTGKVDPRGGVVLFVWPGAVHEALQAWTRETGLTSYMTVLAAFQALLARHTGQLDFLVGSPVANRNRVQTENVVGLFANVVVLRGDLREDPTFREHAARAREVTLEAFDAEDLPFEKLVEELRPERRLDQNPLFQAAFGFQQQPIPPEHEGARLAIESISAHSGTAKFELSLILTENPGWFQGLWEYSAALFDHATIARLATHMEVLLASALADPGRRVSELEILTAPERHQLLCELTDSQADYPRDATIHELFAAQAERSPDAVALEHPGGTVTYAALARAAGRRADALREAGVRPGDRVGVFLERGPELVEAFLAILLAGAAYVPLDPDYPEERLALLLADAGIGVLITREGLRGRLPAGPRLLLWEEGTARTTRTARTGGGALSRAAGEGWGGGPQPADSLAYVLYTSGSTGRPKGVAVPHRAVVRLVLGTDYVALTPEDRVAQASSSSFDAATFEIWGALLNGARLVLLPRDTTISPDAFARVLTGGGVSALFLTTALFNRMAAHDPAVFRRLRHLLFGGEAVDPARVAAVLAAGAPRRLLHVYGPTESTTFATWHLVAREKRPAGTVPIGGPLANTTAVLLNATGIGLQPVPLGVAGEVFLGGDGLARGYLERPDLTAERFVPSVLPGDAPGARLYRTGDLARLRTDGAIEFLGRRDAQVKIRGFRIEPAEVEAALGTHPGVRQAVVLARRSGAAGAGAGGELALVAYYSSHHNAAVPQQSLREHLRSRLPEFMVPAVYIAVPEIPRTPNGKVDRAALPDPDASGLTASSGYQPPRTPAEEVLASLWAGVLRVSRVGAHDNFFDLGGHSLAAMSLTSQVRSAFRIELPTRAVFEAPTLAELAARIEEIRAREQGLDLPPVTRVLRAPGVELPLSFAQQRLWFEDEMAGGVSTFYNVPFSLLLQGDLDVPALAAALTEIARRHEALRTTFRAGAGGRPVQEVHPPAPVPLPRVDLDALPPAHARAEALRIAAQEESLPFSLTRGPLLRVVLLRLSDREAAGEHALVTALHHIVSDGWSLEIFLRELGTLYAHFSQGGQNGRESSLPELPVQYPDFALWQRRHLAGPRLDRQLAFWRERLAGVPLEFELPADRPRPEKRPEGSRGGEVRFELAPALAADLETLSRRAGVTMFMTLFSGFTALLYRYTGQASFLVGTPAANRNHAEIEGLIGFFVNLLALHADLSGDPGFSALLGRARETALDAYTHQDLPFERLVEELRPSRNASRRALFQVSVSLTVSPWQALELQGLTFSSLREDGGAPSPELFGLSLQALTSPHGLTARLLFDAGQLDPATARRLARHLETLLEAGVAEPGRPISDLPLLSDAERAQLLEWSRSAPPSLPSLQSLPSFSSVVSLFEARCDRSPAALALLWENGELSYEELDRRANRLARHLVSQGAGPERTVALRLEDPVDFVVSILAVWKTGGAYLPLDTALPLDRQSWMLADGGAQLLVTRERLAAAALATALPTVHLDADRPALTRQSPERLGTVIEPGQLAYLLYTSGSTGRPKGVLISHGALAAHCRQVARDLRLGPDDRNLQLASFTFDLSLQEVFPVLSSGGTVVPARGKSASPDDLARTLADFAVTSFTLTVTPWHQSAREWAEGRGWPAGVPLPPLRWVLVGGEALVPGALALWQRTPLGGVQLLHGYGVTEATIFSVCHRAAPAEAASGDSARLPIGRPLGHTALYLLDARGDLVPSGATGEIHLGGPILARGYRGRPDLTAAAFVPDPFGGTPGARLYRTGDLARLRSDAEVEFLGRRDHQVKLRGYRIEPGEVEAALAAHPGVSAAAVVLRDGETLEARGLVGYVVAAEGGMPAASELRAFLRERLPAYMVPSAFVELEALPLTAAGKVDRAALIARAEGAPSPTLPRSAGEGATAQILRSAQDDREGPVPPAAPPEPAVSSFRQSLEAVLADIWREVLGVEEVGLEENFFDLGGHSMLLALLRARLQQELGVDLQMLDLFQLPTVAALAARLEVELGGLAPLDPEPGSPAVAVVAGVPAAESRGRWTGSEIAIIGMAGRFPGADDLDQLWANLRDGVESISTLVEGWQPPAAIDRPFAVPRSGVLEGADGFDADFFNIPEREAELTDPQHRLFLECSWQALEDAGYDAEQYLGGAGVVGVFGGASKNDYLETLRAAGAFDRPEDAALAATGTERDFLTVRVSYKIGLEGPSVNVQSGCSTSLAAIHLACRSLLAGDCDMALAGGASVGPLPRRGYIYEPGGLLSADGCCRSYDVQGSGTVDSDGAGVVVLRRLADALADGDAIRAVILGTGFNNDGYRRLGIRGPRQATRARVIRDTLQRAGVDPGSISFIEGNGTAAPLGEPVEIAAILEAFAGRTTPCALGSVKSNLGHTGSASGVASVLKTALALEHRQIPPSLHFTRFNPEVDRPGNFLQIATRLQDWEPAAPGSPRRACVNSFSHGGTNVILVVEEAPEREPAAASPASGRTWHLLPLSARTPAALEAATDRLARHLESHPGLPLADVAFTLQTGRRAFEHRRFVLARTLDEARAALAERNGATGIAERRSPAVPLEMADSAESLEEAGRLWLSGVEIDWRQLHGGETRRRVPLPTYPFERRRFWVGPPVPSVADTEPDTTPATADESAEVTV